MNHRKLLDRALARFSPRDYLRVTSVPVFREHVAHEPWGRQVYDRAALAELVEGCNRRIAASGDFAALTAGHTPRPGECGPAPAVVGFAGPFRLGRLAGDGAWAIFAEEWRRRDALDQLAARPRRSVELWLHPQMNQRFFDPIAALGAETPRLGLGLAPPSTGPTTRFLYQEQAMEPALDSAACEAVATRVYQRLASRFEAAGWLPTEAASESVAPAASSDPPPREAELEAEVARLRQEAAVDRRGRIDREREQRLERLALRYAFDLGREKRRCLLESGSGMSDDQFAAHVETIAELAPPLPAGAPLLPAGELPPEPEPDAEQRLYERAVRIADEARNRGERIDGRRAYELARAES